MFHTVLRLHKDDLIASGWDKKMVAKLSNEDMERINRRLADGLMSEFWSVLSIINSDQLYV